MNGKWLRIGMVATVAALAGALALSASAFAQSGTPPTPAAGARYAAGIRGAWGGPSNSLVAIAAEVLGVDPAELLADLAAGKTIAEVAQAQGVDLDTVVDAVIAPRAEVLRLAVADGRLTQVNADAITGQVPTVQPAAEWKGDEGLWNAPLGRGPVQRGLGQALRSARSRPDQARHSGQVPTPGGQTGQ